MSQSAWLTGWDDYEQKWYAHQKQCQLIRLLVLCILAISKNQKRSYRRKKYWVANIFRQRPLFGAFFTTIEELKLEMPRFINYFRMDLGQYEELLALVAPKLQKQFVFREPISPDERLALTLRYLASGDSMVSMSYSFRIGLTTVSHIIRETCEAIWDVLSPIVLKTPTSQEWQQIENEFNVRWNFPNCIGAIDGKHVVIQAPSSSGSTYYNYKGTHSIVLLAACRADYVFTMVDVGAQGRRSDGGIFSNSAIGRYLKSDVNSIPPPKPICEDGVILPHVVVGDEAFPLLKNLMRPYPGREGLSVEKRIYNYRLSRARRTIENAFGILASQWRIYRKPIIASMETTKKIVQATVCLHNFLRVHDVNMISASEEKEEESAYSDPDSAFQPASNLGAHSYSRQAASIRDQFMEHFNEEGAVPWQDLKIYM